jgi:serine/threonine protein kinase
MRACVRCSLPLATGAMVCARCAAPQPYVSTTRTLQKGFSISNETSNANTTLKDGDRERIRARYVLDQALGEGAMGVVWRAWRFIDPAHNRFGAPPELVALKFLTSQAERAHTQGVRRAYEMFFRSEAEALGRLLHPNVVGLVEVFDAENMHVLAMEFVDGDTFEQILARHRERARAALAQQVQTLPGLPFQRAYYYFEQLLGALAACHALGIVHRDVKPSNVLVRRDGIAKLTDFGIAHVKKRTAYVVGVGVDGKGKQEELGAGTGLYMSPEQVKAEVVDGRSDLYSAAIVLFELLTGRTPYETDDKPEWILRMNHVQAEPHSILRFLPQAPRALEQLFFRALAKHPSQRFGSAIEMGAAFRQALSIPDSPAWRAQVELADEAAKVSNRTGCSAGSGAQVALAPSCGCTKGKKANPFEFAFIVALRETRALVNELPASVTVTNHSQSNNAVFECLEHRSADLNRSGLRLGDDEFAGLEGVRLLLATFGSGDLLCLELEKAGNYEFARTALAKFCTNKVSEAVEYATDALLIHLSLFSNFRNNLSLRHTLLVSHGASSYGRYQSMFGFRFSRRGPIQMFCIFVKTS